MIITLVTAGWCGLLLFVLSLRVVQMRFSHKVNLGDGGNEALLARVRTQANFTEYVPIILVLMGLIETRTGGSEMLAATGILLVLIRVAHAIGMGRPAPNAFRMAGAGGTWVILVGLSIWAITLAYSHGG